MGATIKKQTEAHTKIWEVKEDTEKGRSLVKEALKHFAGSDREVTDADERLEKVLEQNAMACEQLREERLFHHLMVKKAM